MESGIPDLEEEERERLGEGAVVQPLSLPPPTSHHLRGETEREGETDEEVWDNSDDLEVIS